MKHLRRCPATSFIIREGQIDGYYRCEKGVGHDGGHVATTGGGIKRWTFAEGSYSGLAPDHPEYDVPVGFGA